MSAKRAPEASVILVDEDEDLVRIVAIETLEDAGYSVVEARHADEAWFVLRERSDIGVLFNEVYAGRIVWNRVRMIKNPDTGRRVSRPNPKLDWQSVEAPELRIIDDATWTKAQARKADLAHKSSAQKRAPAHMLSGLLRCGCCGSGYSVHDRDKTGKTRIRCSAVRESGTYTNRRILHLLSVERVVLTGLVSHLANPILLDEFVDAYNAERKRFSSASPEEQMRLRARHDALNAELERVKRGLHPRADRGGGSRD